MNESRVSKIDIIARLGHRWKILFLFRRRQLERRGRPRHQRASVQERLTRTKGNVLWGEAETSCLRGLDLEANGDRRGGGSDNDPGFLNWPDSWRHRCRLASKQLPACRSGNGIGAAHPPASNAKYGGPSCCYGAVPTACGLVADTQNDEIRLGVRRGNGRGGRGDIRGKETPDRKYAGKSG